MQGSDLEASENRLHPGVWLQLLDSDILQGVWILPLAAALHHAQEAVQIESNNARKPFEPVCHTSKRKVSVLAVRNSPDKGKPKNCQVQTSDVQLKSKLRSYVAVLADSKYKACQKKPWHLASSLLAGIAERVS